MTMTTTDVTTITPLAHQEAMRLQAHELERTLTLLRSLDQASWAAATDCPAWDIRAMYQHVLGACEAGASMPENIGQLRSGPRSSSLARPIRRSAWRRGSGLRSIFWTRLPHTPRRSR